MILISYIIIKLLIMENHPSQNQKQNSAKLVLILWKIVLMVEAKVAGDTPATLACSRDILLLQTPVLVTPGANVIKLFYL